MFNAYYNHIKICPIYCLQPSINVTSDLQKMKKTTDHLKWIFEFKGADVILVTFLLTFLLAPTISRASNHELKDGNKNSAI